MIPVSSVEFPTKPAPFSKSGSAIPSAAPPPDTPYALPANLFPLPDNVSGVEGSGNFSSLALSSGILGGTPTLFLLYAEKTGPSTYSVLLITGSYNATAAWMLLGRGTCSPGSQCHLPVRWGYPVYLTNSSHPIQGVALVSYSGALIAAYATSGTTYFSEATDGGVRWTPINHINGTSPMGSAADGDVVFTVRQGNVSTIQRFAVNCGTPVEPGSVVSTRYGTPVVAPSGVEGQLVSSSTNGSVAFYPIHGGNTLGAGVTIGMLDTNSTSPIFNAIGSTLLATVPGSPGQVAATAVNNTVFGLFTTSEQGRTVASTTVSGDGGAHWSPTEFGATRTGTIENPAAVASPSGLVFVSWMSNSNGSWQIEQSIYSADGRLRVGPNPIAGSGGTPGSSVVDFAATVMPTGQPFYAWIANVSGQRQLRFSGAYPSALAAAILLNKAAQALAPLDFADGSAAYRSTLLSNTAQVLADVGSGQDTNAATLLEGTLYPEVSGVRLALLCAPTIDPQPACKVLQPTSGHLLVQTAGPFSAPSILAWYVNLTLAALGVGVTYPDLTPHFLLAGAGSACTSQQFAQIAFSNPPGTFNPPATPGWLTTWADNSTSGSSATAFSHVVNPKGANLSITYSFAPIQSSQTSYSHFADLYTTWCNVTAPTDYRVTVKVGTAYNTGPTATFSGGGRGTTVYLVNLTANGLVYWGVTVRATVQTTQYLASGSDGSCPPNSPSTVLSTSTVTLPGLAGYLSTSMGILGAHVNASATGANQVLVSWNNSMPAQSWLNITPPTLPSGHNVIPTDPENFVVTNLTNGQYNFAGASLSLPGGIPANSKPNVSENVAPPTSRPESGSWSEGVCGFVPGLLQVSNVGITNLTDGNASLSWVTNFRANGTVTLYTYGSNVTTTTSWITSETGGGSGWVTKFEMHGLRAFSSYSFRVLVNVTYCGITYNALSSWTGFQTPDDFPITAYDEPYDSITQEGGGSQVAWVLPQFFVKSTMFRNGTIVYYPTANVSATVVVPLLQLSPIWPSGLSDWVSFVANLSLPQPNTNYSVAVELNYTYTGTNTSASATSFVYSFIHLKDTSGDGLTDLEKVYGWSVTTQNATGVWQAPRHVTADPTLWATNGLTNDFVEKQFGLDPATVDSASSHMLDTWNLTFDLGSAVDNPQVPTGANFELWYENSTYDPFVACQYPGQPGTPHCSGFLQGTNLTNLTAQGDSSPWAAQVLWSRSQLSVFDNLSGVRNASWLRGVFGTHNGLRTLTVWGKLSWGADPLATSTSQDGVADGARVNPLYDEDLQINFQEYAVGSCGILLPKDSATALQFHVSGAYGGFSGNNYSRPVNQSFCPGGGTAGENYILTLPVSNIQPTETVEISFVANISTNRGQAAIVALPVSGCDWRFNLTVSMFNATPVTNGQGAGAVILQGNPSGGCTAAWGVTTTLEFGATEVPAGLKVPTYLWVPNDNSTLSSLPWGLKKYTGEQSFDVVIVNNGYVNTVTSDPVPTPWNGTSYYVNASPGLSEILIPRGQFLNSTFGEALLLNRSLPNASKIVGPLLSSSEGGVVANQSHAATLANLACYWQNRSVWHDPWLCPGAAGGTPSNSSLTVSVVDASSCSSANCGGVPSNPLMESSQYAGPALQFVATLNLSSGLGSGTPQLDALLGSLLDNGTGGLNGTLQPVTAVLGTLGLSNAVIRGLANAALESGGNFGAPVSNATAVQQPSGTGLLGVIVNAAAGEIYDLATGNWEGVLWNIEIASAAFILLYAEVETSVLLTIANRTAAALAVVGSDLRTVLNEFLSWVASEVSALLNAVISPVATGLTNAFSAWSSYRQAAISGAIWSFERQNGTGLPPANVTQNMALFLAPILVAATAVTVVAAIGCAVLLPLSLGAGFLIGLALPLLIQAFQLAAGFLHQQLLSPQAQSLLVGNPNWGIRGIVELQESFFNLTQSIKSVAVQIPGYLSHQDWMGYAGMGFEGMAMIIGLIATAVTSVSRAFGFAGYAGFALGLTGLFVNLLAAYGYANLPSNCTTQPNMQEYQTVQSLDLVAGGLSTVGTGVSAAGLVEPDNPNARWLALAGTIVGVVGAGLSYADAAGVYDACG